MSRLAAGEVIIGDGSYIYTLERRGYATAGVWTPEAAAEDPRAVEQLAIEFARAGADITQTFSFWCHEDKLPKGCKFSVMANSYSTLKTISYQTNVGKPPCCRLIR